jgi:hypothetical protein
MIMEKLTVLFFERLLRTQRHKEEIEKILQHYKYVVECKFDGCFGSGVEKIVVKITQQRIVILLSMTEHAQMRNAENCMGI